MADENIMSLNDGFPYDCILYGSEKITSDYLVGQFKMLILSDKFPPGYPLPTENTLCERLGIGRSTLREAFKVLSAYGLITRTKHGTFVNDSVDFSTSLMLDYCFEEAGVKDLLEFRKIFEAESAWLAAQKATTDDIKNLKEIMIKMENCGDDPAALSYNDVAFHFAIAKCAHNKLLISIMKLISNTYYKGIRSNFEKLDHVGDKTPLDATLGLHTRIFDAILLRDPEAAAAAMREHLDLTLEAVEDLNEP